MRDPISIEELIDRLRRSRERYLSMLDARVFKNLKQDPDLKDLFNFRFKLNGYVNLNSTLCLLSPEFRNLWNANPRRSQALNLPNMMEKTLGDRRYGYLIRLEILILCAEYTKMERVFVFGSNTRGIHRAGAAQHAYTNFGAVWGVGEGMTGCSYAIPTDVMPKIKMDFDQVVENINKFIRFASQNPQMDFEITKVGCGYAGHQERDILRLFKDAPHNCHLPPDWEMAVANRQVAAGVKVGFMWLAFMATIMSLIDFSNMNHLLINICWALGGSLWVTHIMKHIKEIEDVTKD